MAENLIPQIARMLGVEVGEAFKIKDNTGSLMSHTLDAAYAFMENARSKRLVFTDVNIKPRPLCSIPPMLLPENEIENVFAMLCRGDCEVVKLPWKPTMYEEYWTFGKIGKKWIVRTLSWRELPYEILLFDKGWVYRTKEEAEAALPAVAAEMGVEYEF